MKKKFKSNIEILKLKNKDLQKQCDINDQILEQFEESFVDGTKKKKNN